MPKRLRLKFDFVLNESTFSTNLVAENEGGLRVLTEPVGHAIVRNVEDRLGTAVTDNSLDLSR